MVGIEGTVLAKKANHVSRLGIKPVFVIDKDVVWLVPVYSVDVKIINFVSSFVYRFDPYAVRKVFVSQKDYFVKNQNLLDACF